MTHAVTVTTRLDDEGTPDETRVVDEVRFACTEPDHADCRYYPDCDCESFQYENDDDPVDQNGHVRIAGQRCLLGTWFEADQAVYAGADYDDMRDDNVPAIDRSGPITVQWVDEYPEWEFIFPCRGRLKEKP